MNNIVIAKLNDILKISKQMNFYLNLDIFWLMMDQTRNSFKGHKRPLKPNLKNLKFVH